MDEHQRLQGLQHVKKGEGAGSGFDDLLALAAAMCRTPSSQIFLRTDEKRWLLHASGEVRLEPGPPSRFCALTLHTEKLLTVADAESDLRFADEPLVQQAPGLRFYAGVPLRDAAGQVLGTLAVMGPAPRRLLPEQAHALEVIGANVVTRLALQQQIRGLQHLCAQPTAPAIHQPLQEGSTPSSQPETSLHAYLQTLLQAVPGDKPEPALSQLFIDSLPGIFYVLDEQGRLVRWNRQLEQVSGHAPATIRTLHVRDFFAGKADQAMIRRLISRVLAQGQGEAEITLRTRNAQAIPYYFCAHRIEWEGATFVCGMGLDIRERRLSEASLHLRNRALEASVNAIIITDSEGSIEYANPAFERITGYDTSETLGRHFRFLQADDVNQPGLATVRSGLRLREACSAVLRNYRKDGTLFWNDFHMAPVHSPTGATTHFVGVLNDITALKAYEEELERQASYDALTGLANKSVLHDRLQHAMASARRHGNSLTVGFMDLDNFKFINDSLGHSIGDALLKRVAERLTTCMRGQDTVARYGGDEFAFVLVEVATEENVSILMDRLLKTVERPFEIDGHTFFISCSIGLCFYPRDGRDVDTLLKNADAAMYRAKEVGRNNYQFYTPALQTRITHRLSMEARLHQALINEEFVLHYQPKVDLGSYQVVGVEALLRWEPPGEPAVRPDAFIGLAEETGLIVPIGEWVLEAACRHNKKLQSAGLAPISVAVNISARQFAHKALMQSIAAALARADLEARYLELELTESLVMHNPEEIIQLLGKLRDMGLLLAIDDFGTGYSSLSYLQRFPLDRLKIDQSFVRDICAGHQDSAIARAVISLGHNLGLRVIAEGVSTQEQLAFLRLHGCNEMQGYLYSRPLPFDALQRLLHERSGL